MHLILSAVIHHSVIIQIIAGGDVIQPLLVVEVPTDSLFDAFLELEGGFPSEFVLELGGVDGITKVMTGAVGDVGDELLAGAFRVAEEAVDSLNHHLHNVDVLPFIEAADVVSITRLAPVENDVDSAGVILHIEPVAYVLSFAVDGQRLSVPDIVDEERDELLRELVGTVVIGAVRDQRGHAVGIVIGAYEVVAAGLGCAVGAMRVVLGGLQEEFAAVGGGTLGLIQLQFAVHFIGGDVVEALALPVAIPVPASSLQQAESAHDIRAGEGEGVLDRAVHMALGGKVNNAVDIVLLHDGAHALEVADVGLHEGVVRLVLDVLKVSEVAGISERIEVDDFVLGVLVDKKSDDMRTDEAGSSCDKNMSTLLHTQLTNLFYFLTSARVAWHECRAGKHSPESCGREPRK